MLNLVARRSKCDEPAVRSPFVSLAIQVPGARAWGEALASACPVSVGRLFCPPDRREDGCGYARSDADG